MHDLQPSSTPTRQLNFSVVALDLVLLYHQAGGSSGVGLPPWVYHSPAYLLTRNSPLGHQNPIDTNNIHMNFFP